MIGTRKTNTSRNFRLYLKCDDDVLTSAHLPEILPVITINKQAATKMHLDGRKQARTKNSTAVLYQSVRGPVLTSCGIPSVPLATE